MSTPIEAPRPSTILRTEYKDGGNNAGHYEIRQTVARSMDWTALADEVLHVQTRLRPAHKPHADERLVLAKSFLLYGTGQVDGAFIVRWERDHPDFVVRVGFPVRKGCDPFPPL